MKIHLRYILTVLLLTGLLESNYWAQAQPASGKQSLAGGTGYGMPVSIPLQMADAASLLIDMVAMHQDVEQVFSLLHKDQPAQGLTYGGLFYKAGAIGTIVKE
ncbi:hypothetical protein [Paraflavitalea speifideaquila]|uniref:hypothetical protein n=1 Tax=Paraflavitalea speifideaquila TaxID=3076558 RepID=UPI0028EDFB61|nr:hypothetical protein [Paraflavitalea speifideiaquila]